MSILIKKLFKNAFILLVITWSISQNIALSQTLTGTPIVKIDTAVLFQTIDNFGASDAWACQFVGNWPLQKKNAIADLLFSSQTDASGNPKGIALSIWRYNLGAGSSNQNNKSGIADEWRRAPSFTKPSKNDLSKIKGQNWFLKAAKKRGVQQFLAFYNSPPVEFTITKQGFAKNGITNIQPDNYASFVNYTMEALSKIHKSTGIKFNYLSPINEPQWKWSDGKQEGCPYSNNEIAAVIKSFCYGFSSKGIETKIIAPEAAHLKYLDIADDELEKDEQLFSFYNKSSANYIANLPLLANSFAYHSYFTTSPFNKAIEIRKKIFDIAKKNGVPQLWQTEYCILGDNEGEINGEGKNIGIDDALYLARTIYVDLVYSNASAWQWWLAVSPYNYKDGLIYVDKEKKDGKFEASKLLWALGNYSRFIHPGSKRFSVESGSKDLLVSGYKNSNGEFVVVFVNLSGQDICPKIIAANVQLSSKIKIYTTDASQNLKFSNADLQSLCLPSKSIVTVITKL